MEVNGYHNCLVINIVQKSFSFFCRWKNHTGLEWQS